MSPQRTLLAFLLTVGIAFSRVLAQDEPVRGTRAKARAVRLVDDPDKTIERSMNEGWRAPERRRWRIEYKPIAGMSSHSEWHVQGTSWWVRFYPEDEMPQHYRLGSLDETTVYEIDAVALDQAYGTIKFWVYGRPQKVAR